VVGAPIDNSAIGAAYSFGNFGGTWSLVGKLTAPAGPDTEVGSRVFGAHLALSQPADTLLVSGQADHNLAGAVWSYAATTPPAVSSVAPTAGPARGGTAVVIHGAGFEATGIDAVGSVTFSGASARSFRVVSPTEVDAVAPPHGAGVADVVVTAPSGASPIISGDEFRYVAAPGAPTKITATAGDRRVKVAFKPKPAAGPITYRVIAIPGGAQASGARSPITVRGLHNGKRYRFRVFATNLGGTSPSSRLTRAITPFRPIRSTRASIRGVARRAPRLQFTLIAGPRSPTLMQVAIALPRGLQFDGRRLAGHVLVGGRTLQGSVTVRRGVLEIRLTQSTRRLTVGVATPALSATASLAREVRHRRAGRRTVTLTIRDAARNTSSLRLRLRVS